MGVLDASVAQRLKQAAGPLSWSEDPAEIAPHLCEWRGRWKGESQLLLRPSETEEVARILSVCDETGTAIVPQGGNTGLVGGQIPTKGEVLLSLQRMNRIRSVSVEDNTLIAEAGVVLANAQKAAGQAGRLFPLSLAAEGSCTIGGNVSTNAGGVNVLRYGMTRDLVLGLEVVLANGRVLDLMRGLRKDNTGYDLKQLFIGAEGTLGIVTAAMLKLYKRMRVTRVTIIRHEGGVLGFAMPKPVQETYTTDREELLSHIQVGLAARAAEELFLGTQLSGVYSDLQNATRAAAAYIGLLGMNGSLYSSAAFGDGSPDPGMKKEIEKLLREQFLKVKHLLDLNHELVVAIAESLLVRLELNGDDLIRIEEEIERRRRLGEGPAKLPERAASVNVLELLPKDGVTSAAYQQPEAKS
jgi:FAD/FMN-containing dehydrogenase